MREFTFHGEDGTRLVGWTNEAAGPRVLLCNGLAAPAASWPGLLAPDCGFEVASWHQRGFFGSDRPGRIEHTRLQVQAHDAVALMDHLGWDSAIFLGWSFGVNMSVEVALEYPDRVTGLVAVAGVPGGTFGSLLGRNPLPPEVRKALGLTGVVVGESQGWGINRAARLMPSTSLLAQVLQRTGFIGGHADPRDVAAMVGAYLTHDFGWYFTTARILAEHAPVDVSGIDIPAEVLIGARDTVTDPRDVARFGRALPAAEVLTLPATHFLPVEYPQEVSAALDRVVQRLGKSDHELRPAEGPTATGPQPSVA
jgi:pimeloyl-ACP methyl ester carboxylesterase